MTSKLEKLGQTALLAFPTLYCRSKSLQAESPMTFILDTYRVILRKKLSEMPFWLRTLVVCVWPPMAIFTALGLSAVNGRFVARRYRRGTLQQFADQIRLAFSEGMLPSLYYVYEMQEPRNSRRAHEFLHPYQLKNEGILSHYYRDKPEQNARAKLLNDKLAFQRFCKENALPTVEIHGVAEKGGLAWFDEGRRQLPDRSLFIKPQRGKGGRNAEKWIYRDGRYSGRANRSLTADELADHVIALGVIKPRLIQEYLVNHPALLEITAGALSTLRMYTFWDERGNAEHVFTMLRMAQDPQSPVDNIHRGGLGASVDPATGELGQATDTGTLGRTGWLDRHPTTGAQISGRKVPFWPEAVDLALSAHRKLQGALVVGWDVAITPEGPKLVEGNKSPGVIIDQRLNGPWGNERFGELLVYHLNPDYSPRGVNEAVSVD